LLDFSIIIPTFERPAHVAGCVESLAQLDYDPNRWEAIFVDDGSTAPADAAVREAARRLPVRMLLNPHGGPAAARNAGAAEARGRWLVFTDDDCRPDPGWLAAFAARFAAEGDCAIGGKSVNAVHDNVCSEASQVLLDYLYERFNAVPGKAQLLISNNFALPVEMFHSIGGFDTSFPKAAAEDRDLCARLYEAGHRLFYEPRAVVLHHHALSLRRFCRQHFNYGGGAWRFHQSRAERASQDLKVEPFEFYWNLLRYPTRHGRRPALALTALMVVSQVANATGFFVEKAKRS
jgi:GT2 family glycosyltransferase